MMKAIKHLLGACLVFLLTSRAFAGTSVTKHIHHQAEWYKTDAARHIADAVLSYQTPAEDWPKNIDTATAPYTGNPADLKGTFDNNATTPELRFLARMASATGDQRYTKAFLRGLDHVLDAQYENGGWPQFSPAPKRGYYRHITFNDDSIARLMYLVRDVAKDDNAFGFVDPQRRRRCGAAWEKAVACILDCQIKVEGKPTVWCAQHDEITLAPAKARAYELPSLSGSESAGLVLLLMDLEDPSDRAKQAIRAAAMWFERSKLTGIKVERRPDPNAPRGFDLFIVKDPAAPPLWARFYDLQTGKPFYCGRDGVKKSSLAEIEVERRTGYAWLGTWGQKVLDRYPQWAATHGMPAALAATAPSRATPADPSSPPR
jgi:PelA/Pel-15E family pectate lyase